LVVDDQETSCIILKNILESWQFQVATELTAQMAQQRIQQAEQGGAPFDLLLVDWQMEGMSGLELALELGLNESQGKLKHPPTIIMVTAYSKEQLLKEATGTPARLDAILTKPVVPSSLLNTILHVYHYQGRDYRIPEMQTDPYEAAQPLRNTRILLVEDNRLNQQVAGEFLEKAGMRVSIANHGGEAVQWVLKEHFDAVLMDLQMPEMDGYEATRRIRELPEYGLLPIIAMTAAAMQHDRDTCLEAGMNDHVAKPINPRELIDTLLRWVKPISHQAILTVSASTSPEAWSDLADSLPGFDLGNIMLMLSGNRTQLLRMLGTFREQFVAEASAIAAQISDGELTAAEKRLHTLKGAAGNLGAKDLHQACAALDAQLMGGHYDATTFAHWLRTFDRTMSTLATLLAQQPIAALPLDGGPTLDQVMTELDALLANDSFIGDELLDRLKSLLPGDKQAEYSALSQTILDTDYLQARAVLKTLWGFAQ
jgi:CheY-like chemotaxis protein